jgi:mono/diheme cytochrome c family protein
MMRNSLPLCALALILGLGCRSTTAGGTPPPSPSRPVPLVLLESLALLATGDTPGAPALEGWKQRLDSGQATLEQFVEAQLADPRFARVVAPSMLFGLFANIPSEVLHDGYILSRKDTPGGPVLYLREPCAPEQAERVQPWWALDTEVRVCPEAHRPERFVEPSTGRHCSAVTSSPGQESVPYCGCGPNLLRCFRDEEQRVAFTRSMVEEIGLTTAYVIHQDLPISTTFTTNATVRDRNAELLYQRWRVESGERPGLEPLQDWSEGPRLAPRHESVPGQHAGVLTASQFVFTSFARRATLKHFYQRLWCVEPDSSHVATDTILKLRDANLEATGRNQELASMPVCTRCHARLDHGMSFFTGFPDGRMAQHFDPTAQKPGTGRLYVEELGDLRGEAELTPAGFARLAVAQPEFARCMVQDVSRHVFSTDASSVDERDMRAAFLRRGNLKDLMRTALLRYAGRAWEQPGATSAPAMASAASAPEQEVLLPRGLKDRIARHCVECHGGREDLRSFMDEALPRDTLQRMLSAVAFERMPQGDRLDPRERRALVRELVDTLWTEEADRREAYGYFGDWMRALPIYPVGGDVQVAGNYSTTPALDAIRTRAGVERKSDWDLVEIIIQQDAEQFTPGFAAVTALEAIRACRSSGAQGKELEACLERASSLKGMVNPLAR